MSMAILGLFSLTLSRGQPLALAREKGSQVQQLVRWAQAVGLYPE